MMSAGGSNDESAPAVARMGHRKRKKECWGGGVGGTYATLSLAGAATSIIFVATSILLSRQKTCFVETKMIFVAGAATTIIFVATKDY